MQRHPATSSFPSTTPLPTSYAAADDWRPSVARPTAARSPHASRRLGQRAMGLVATLTLVALVGLSGLAVYLNAPRDNAPPTTLAAVGLEPTDATLSAPPTPVRADATSESGPGFWTLPETAYADLPAAETYGEGWHTLSSVTLGEQPGTSFQIETRYYVNNEGSRIRIMLVRDQDAAQLDEALAYFTEEIQRYQESVYRYDEPARTERLTAPLIGCSEVARAEGLEWVTSFRITATLCRSSDPHVVILVSVNGDIGLTEVLLQPHPADGVLTRALAYIGSAGTPTPTP